MTQTIIKIPAQSSFDPTDITISDNTSAAFLVQDSSQEFIRVNTTTGARKIDLETGLANQYLIISENANYVQLRNGAHNQFFMSNLETTLAAIKFFSHEQVSGGYFRSRSAAGVEIMRLDENGNITTKSNNFTFRNGSANPMLTIGDNVFTFNGGANVKHIETYGEPRSQDASHSYGDFLLELNNTFKFGSGGSGPATIDADWYVTRVSNTSAFGIQYVTLHNLNATHNVIFRFPVRSGYGTAIGMDSDATAFLDSSGSFTLTPGQAAIMEIKSYNALGTDAGIRHYVKTLGKG